MEVKLRSGLALPLIVPPRCRDRRRDEKCREQKVAVHGYVRLGISSSPTPPRLGRLVLYLASFCRVLRAA